MCVDRRDRNPGPLVENDGVSQQIDWKSIRAKAGPFPPKAYEFVRQGLAFTATAVHGDRAEEGPEGSRHVSGQQLCLGLKDFAIRQYGLLAKPVLSSWHIRSTGDFGRIVFAMIEAEMMRKTDEDTPEDFENVFEFDDVFADLDAMQ